MKIKYIFSKIISFTLVIMMIFSFSVNVSAQEDTSPDDAVAKVGETTYNSLGAAMTSANNAEVVLLKDVELKQTIFTTTGWNITLDLNGHKIYGDKDTNDETLARLIYVGNNGNGSLTIKDSSNDKNGLIETKTTTAITNVSNVKIESGTIKGVYGIKQQYAGTIEISGGSIETTNTAIDTGSYKTTVNISGGKILCGDESTAEWERGIVAKNNTNIIMTGGTVQAADGIKLSGGNLNISGDAKILATRNAVVALNENTSVTINNGSLSGKYNAINLDQSFGGSLIINGGNLKDSGSSLRDNSENGNLVISGGTFGQININANRNGKFISGGNFQYNPSSYIADGYFTEKNSDDTYDVKTIVAKVNKYNQSSLQMAVDFAWNNATITLCSDVKEDITIPSNKILTIDLNGYSITNEKSHTIYNQGRLTVIDSSEGKDGLVDNITHAKAALYNEVGATAILNTGTFTRSKENGINTENNGGNSYYTILNHGTMTFNGDVKVNQGIDQAGRYSSLVENGWQDGSKNTTGVQSTMTIKNGEFNGGLNTIKNDDYGVLTIENGAFTNSSQATILNWNVATIKNGTFTGDQNVILNGKIDDLMDKGELTIIGGTFNAANGLVIRPNGTDAGSIKVLGGAFNKSFNSKYLDKGYVAVLKDSNYQVKKLNEAITDDVCVVLLNKTEYTVEQYPTVNGYVFAGWFADKGCETVVNDNSEMTFAKFVNENVLSVKAKLKDDTTVNSEKTNIRFVTTVDSLNYKEIGFEITINNKPKIIPVKTVYTNIVAGSEEVSFDESLSSFNPASFRFATYTITNVPQSVFNTPINVKPYWITLSGEKVYGVEYTVTVADLCDA